jgi:hypothetical protein
MRWNLRIFLRPWTFFAMLSKTQTLQGLTSKVVNEPEEKHLHYILWDLDKGTLAEVEQKLGEAQRDFKLGDIYVFSDAEGSYRAFCWSKRPWITYLHILIHSFPLLDYGFWVWTVRRGLATLRTSDKVGRPHQECVKVLEGFEPTVFPEKVCYVQYDTGIEKQGRLIELG